MSAAPLTPPLPWSTRLTISTDPAPPSLTGDKIHLPQSALEQLLSAAAQVPVPLPDQDPWARPAPASRESLLPHPLIVKLTNRTSTVSVYAVPREFSASEGAVVVSDYLRKALGEGEIEVEAASLPKGNKVRLRPLEAGYDDEDWKPILERYIRQGFATVAEGMVLEVPRGTGKGKVWRFLVDQALPDGVICVVDTDLEVDIEALDEEQARETLKRRLQQKSSGGKLALEQTVEGEVAPGFEHFYQLDTWDHTRPVEIELDGIDLEEGEDIDFFVTTDRQHHKPRLEEHVWGEMSSDFPKRIQISPGNIEIEDAKALHIGVRGWKDPAVDDEEPTTGEERRYTLTVTQADVTSSGESSEDTSEAPSPDHKRCPNCTQWIPARTSYLHESFCLRNNVYCGLCNTVFKRGTESDHWHCEHCNAHGNSPSSRTKHLLTTHTPHKCPSSSCTYTASSLSDLASHRTSVCPSKLILCPFCHLIVPQEGSETPDAEQIISGLTFHELQCGSRTTECNICSRRTRLRDMSLHLKDHELQRLSRPVPKICANPQCCRSPSDANGLGICEVCFGPLYAPGYDPTGSQLRNRVERKLLRQLLAGCRKSWCRSRMCRTGRENLGMMVDNMGTMEALPLVQNRGNELPLCVDESTAKRRELAEALAAESVLDQGGKGGYRTEFCVRAVEAASGDLDRARKWLEREGVRIGER